VLYVTVLAAKGAQALLAPISRHPWIEKFLKLDPLVWRRWGKRNS